LLNGLVPHGPLPSVLEGHPALIISWITDYGAW
jgi:hypothetical protein